MDFVTASTGLISPYWMGLPIRYIQKTFLAFLTHNLHYFQKLSLHKKIAKVIKTLAIQSTVNTFPEALQVLVLLYQF